MSVTDHLLRPLLARDPARPMLTYYDGPEGYRVELSVATAANWAAKTANWLRDECDVEPGAPVVVALPAHWQTLGVLLGSWWCGAHVVGASGADGEAEVAFVPAAEAAAYQGAAATIAAVGLDALGMSGAGQDDDAVDYTTEIRVQPDDFVPWSPVSGSTPALLGMTVDEVLSAAEERASALGVERGSRVLSALEWTLPAGVLDGVLAVFAREAGLVQYGTPPGGVVDPERLVSLRDSELATLVLPRTGGLDGA
ncbi:TIGR03089 family protein [Actinoalloteichus spitiensis]|uniref:TIGR03089 family protein n=1 Tax=Actinoalloteichus spitiensis TaxID=252394 RepID=UPI00037A7824|nr:TIGR03089 family protein [Actinoalloteichus spitiensis]